MTPASIFTILLILLPAVSRAANFTVDITPDGWVKTWVKYSSNDTQDYDVLNFITCMEFNYNRVFGTNLTVEVYESSQILVLSFPDPDYNFRTTGKLISRCSKRHYTNNTVGYLGTPGQYDMDNVYLGNLRDGISLGRAIRNRIPAAVDELLLSSIH